jgi:hypothetical protein
MDVITNTAIVGTHCDAEPLRVGGQTFLAECGRLDDYDLELESYLGIDKIVNESKAE